MKGHLKNNQLLPPFSNDIYKEVSILDLMNDYNQSKQDSLDFKFRKNEPPLFEKYSGVDYRVYFKEAIAHKLQNIKKILKSIILNPDRD